MHVPEENLTKYRALKRISDAFDSLGGQLSNIGHYPQANDAWSMSYQYKQYAQLLRVPGRVESADT